MEDLAAASRILADQGVFDSAGHVSMRHPRHAERFLMSRSLAPELVTADDIMEFTLDCEACETLRTHGVHRALSPRWNLPHASRRDGHRTRPLLRR